MNEWLNVCFLLVFFGGFVLFVLILGWFWVGIPECWTTIKRNILKYVLEFPTHRMKFENSLRFFGILRGAAPQIDSKRTLPASQGFLNKSASTISGAVVDEGPGGSAEYFTPGLGCPIKAQTSRTMKYQTSVPNVFPMCLFSLWDAF